ncbi:MAG: DUF859 family phage minor structural protein, partial [Bacilli bacterium]|nr:DUF859 family phage minor structural protein [Bacilli bacterium]
MVLNNNYQELKKEYLFDSNYGLCYEYLDAKLATRTPEQLAQDKINNLTYVTLRQRVGGGSWYSPNCYSIIDGNQYTIPGTLYNSYTRELTIPIPHASDGTAINITKSAYFYSLWNDDGLGAIEGTFDLPSIPRGSKIAVSPVTYLNSINSFMIIVTDYLDNPTKSYKIYANDVLIRSVDDYPLLNQTSSFTTAELEAIYEQMPNSHSMWLTFELTTYIGETTDVKTTTGLVYAGDYGQPDFSDFELSDSNIITAALGSYVKQQSLLQVLISVANKAVPKFGASIISYEIDTGSDILVIGYEEAIDAGLIVPKPFLLNGNIKVSAIDSRNSKTTVEKYIDLLDYELPDINFIQTERTNGV